MRFSNEYDRDDDRRVSARRRRSSRSRSRSRSRSSDDLPRRLRSPSRRSRFTADVRDKHDLDEEERREGINRRRVGRRKGREEKWSDDSDDDDDGRRSRRRTATRRRERDDDDDGDDDRRRRSYSRSRSPSRERRRERSSHIRDADGRDLRRNSNHRDHNNTNNDRAPFIEGEIKKGVVRSIQAYGLFVRVNRDIAEERIMPDGLVYAQNVSDDLTFQRDDTDEAKKQSLSYFFPEGTEVFVKILKCEKDEKRGNGWKIGMTMKDVDQENGIDKGGGRENNNMNKNKNKNNININNKNGNNNNNSNAFEADLYGVYEGKVSQIKPYGVFVNLENSRTSALVHVSEISEHLRFDRDDTDEDKVQGIEGVLSVGESCFVKIIEMKQPEGDGDRMKLSASIRLVDQKTGEDFDPENMKLRQKRDGGDRFNNSKKPVGADAGENIKKSGIVNWGHLEADVKEKSHNKYDFVIADVEELVVPKNVDDYSKPRFGFGLDGYVPEIRRDTNNDGGEKNKNISKKRKQEKKEKKSKKKKSRKSKSKSKKGRRSPRSSSSSYSSDSGSSST
jgi:DNA-directed RNA polymerase subunit E'/Rpb7